MHSIYRPKCLVCKEQSVGSIVCIRFCMVMQHGSVRIAVEYYHVQMLFLCTKQRIVFTNILF